MCGLWYTRSAACPKVSPDGIVLKDDTEFEHAEAVLDLFSVFTGDSAYSKVYQELFKERVKRGEWVTMCKVVDAYMTKGRLEGRNEIIFKLLQEGNITLQVAAVHLGLMEEVRVYMAEKGYPTLLFC